MDKFQLFQEFLDLLPNHPQGTKGCLEDVGGNYKWKYNGVVTNKANIIQKLDELKTSRFFENRFDVNTEDLKASRLNVAYEFHVNDKIYKDIDDFKSKLLSYQLVPTTIYFFSTNTYYTESSITSEISTFIERRNKIEEILGNFANNSHHYESKQGYMIYVNPKSDHHTSSIKLTTKISTLKKYSDLLDQDINFEALEIFKNEDKNDIVQLPREKAILRNTIIEFITQDVSEDNIFNPDSAAESTYYLLSNSYDFDKKYNANLQVYLKDISLDKLKIEIATEQIKYSEQVSKILQDILSKIILVSGLQALIIMLTRKEGLLNLPILPSVLVGIISILTLLSLYANAVQLHLVEVSYQSIFSKMHNKLLPEKNNKNDIDVVLNLIDPLKNSFTKAKAIFVLSTLISTGLSIFLIYML